MDCSVNTAEKDRGENYIKEKKRYKNYQSLQDTMIFFTSIRHNNKPLRKQGSLNGSLLHSVAVDAIHNIK